MGVSICLDLVSIESLNLDIAKEWVPTVKKISTASKSKSRRSRYLDDRDISIEIKTSQFRLDINVQTKKSRSRSRNSSRSENFGVSRQFVSISFEKCVDFCIFSSRFLYPLRLFIIFRLKRPRQCRDFSTNLDKSRKSRRVLTNLDNLNASRQSRQKSRPRKKKSWSWHDGHSRRFSKVSLDTKDILDLDLHWSRPSRPPTLLKLHIRNIFFEKHFWKSEE